jgi:hypothetical protein
LPAIWAFLGDETNRAILSWIGGGVVVVFGGLWAAFKLFLPRKEDEKGCFPLEHNRDARQRRGQNHIQ